MDILKRWANRFRNWVFGLKAVVAAVRPKGYEQETLSSFVFKKQVLDRLPEYFKVLGRMRFADPEAYKLYSQLGAHLSPPDAKVWHMSENLSPWWKETRPTFGCLALTMEDEENANSEWLYPRFIYFQKYKPAMMPPDFQRAPMDWDVYGVTVYWDDRDANVPTMFPVGMAPDGSVKLLRTRFVETVHVRGKHGKNRNRSIDIPHTRWGVDKFFQGWAKAHNQNPEQYLLKIFGGAASTFEAANGSMVRVTVEKAALTAVFGIDPRRSAYFFKDRVDVVGSRGQKKRIFHIVRPHDRKGTKAIKMHFRGLRDFTWHGYDIHVTVPGLHHAPLAEFNAGAVDIEAAPNTRGYVQTGTMAKRFKEAIKK